MLRLWCLCLLGLCASGLCSRAAPWATATNDLPPDPTARWGSLPNGLRYAILPNHEPKGRISLRLLVSAGSLHERDDETGLAHFIEHMAFRGTRAYPRGSLIPALARLGMGLGPDNTAFTTYNYTIYHLELPDTTAATLRLGLEVFREYAEGITFEPALINLERGVVLSEKATRNTPEARLGEAHRAFLWPAAREVRRAPIGQEKNLQQFTRDQFVAFYDAWYRPERMAVIIVGDIQTDDAVRLVGSVFDSLQARGAAREEPPDLIAPGASAPSVGLFRDPGLTGLSFTLEHPSPYPPSVHTHAQRVAALHRALAFTMLQKRLEESTHQVVGSYVAPSTNVQSPQPDWLLASISVAGSLDNWRPLAADIEQQHRRAFAHGFNREELRQAKARMAAAYDNAVQTANTRSSPALASDLASTLLYGGVFTTPTALQADIAADLEQTTPADCLAAFRAIWSTGPLHIFLGLNSQSEITETDVATVLNQSRNVAVLPLEEKALPTFAYTDFGSTGSLRRQEQLDDLEVRLSEFQNGVRLNFKATTFEADSIDICVRVGNGRLSRPPERPGLDLFANVAMMSGGVGRHSVVELNALFAGHNFGVSFNVGDDAFVFYARCSRRDLLLCLQVIAAYLTDPAYHPGMIRDVRASLTSIYASLANSPSGPIQAKAELIMTGGDPRFGMPTMDEVMSRDYAELAQWLEPHLKHGAIEMGVVGDVSWAEVADAAGRTLGALPARDPLPQLGQGAPVSFTPLRNAVTFPTNSTLTQSSLAFFWPAPDIADTHQERRCVLLAAVLAERVRERLREELGATYTPSAQFFRREAFRGLSYFVITAEISPAHTKQAAQIVAQEIRNLQVQGVDEETFARVRQPLLREREDALRTNDYWLYTVLADAQQNPLRLTAARDRTADNAAANRADMDFLLRRYFSPQNVFLLATQPTGAEGKVVVGPPLKAAQVDRIPQALRQVKPVYPRALRARNITGAVTVEFVVGATGKVSQVKVISSPELELSRAAEAAVLQWEFTPGEKNGQKVNTLLRVEVVFDLKDEKK